MSMFDYMLTEGEQAEEYKAKKAKEEEDRKKAEEERKDRRFKSGRYPGRQMTYKNPETDMDKREDLEEKDYARNSHTISRLAKSGDFDKNDYEAVNKDFRRHPDKLKKFISSQNYIGGDRDKRESLKRAGFKENGIFESVRFLGE